MKYLICIIIFAHCNYSLVGQAPDFPFLPDTTSFEKVSEIALAQHSNTTLLCDKAGYVWVGSEVGVFRYDGYQWLKFEQPNNALLQPIDPATNGIIEDKNGTFWRSSHKTGLVQFDYQNNILKNIRPGDTTLLAIQNVLSAKPFRWNADTLIINTMLGFFFYNIHSNVLSEPFVPYPDSSARFSPSGSVVNDKGNTIRGIAKHASERNKIWITTAKELLLFDIATSSFEYIKIPFQNEGINQPIAPIDVITYGNEIMITTWGAGIAVLNPETASWSNTLIVTPVTADVGLYNVIHRLNHIEDDLFIYAGSDQVGLYNHAQKTTSPFIIKDEYTLGHFTDVMIDHRGVVWALCHAGLFRSKHALFPRVAKPKLTITACSINNRLQNLDTTSGVVNLEVPVEGDISLKFALVNPVYPNRYVYEYRLQGIDKNWRSITPSQSISYNNIKGGTFSFEARIKDQENIVSEHLAQITFKILLYQKLWFKIFLFLLLGIGLIWYNRNRIMKTRKEEKLKAQYESEIAKMEMQALRSQMNPHFIFNSLNSIKNYVVKKGPNEAADYLTKFSQLIRIILENSKLEFLSLEQEIKALTLYIEIENKRFKEKFDFVIDIDSDIDLSNTKIPPMLIQPFIENAIWHGLMHKEGPRKLLLQFIQLENGVLCTVEDNGIGREASGQISPSRSKKNSSLGTAITNNRIDLINKIHHNLVKTEIEDLMDHQRSMGTRVKIFIRSVKEKN